VQTQHEIPADYRLLLGLRGSIRVSITNREPTEVPSFESIALREVIMGGLEYPPLAPLEEPGTESFDVSSDRSTVVKDPQYEPMNVCRVTALSALLDESGQAARGLGTELNELGFSSRLASGDGITDQMNVGEVFRTFRRDHPRNGAGADRRRLDLWRAVNESGHPDDVGTFLLTLLGSELELESTAAASALWWEVRRYVRRNEELRRQWVRRLRLAEERFSEGMDAASVEQPVGTQNDGGSWQDVFEDGMSERASQEDDLLVLMALLQERLLTSLGSPNQLARDLALTPFMNGGPVDENGQLEPMQPDESIQTDSNLMSTIVHGTWGWGASWWRPGQGSFHEFARLLRPNLYASGAWFSWSGAYKEKHRQLAAKDFCDWRRAIAPEGLQTVFAHSYGGEVVARAILDGAPVRQLALLSVPVTEFVKQATAQLANQGGTTLDIRLRFDPVLMGALKPQRFRWPYTGNVDTTLLRGWRLGHGSTHAPNVWEQDRALRQLLASWR
jgi:hypothetical protein